MLPTQPPASRSARTPRFSARGSRLLMPHASATGLAHLSAPLLLALLAACGGGDGESGDTASNERASTPVAIAAGDSAADPGTPGADGGNGNTSPTTDDGPLPPHPAPPGGDTPAVPTPAVGEKLNDPSCAVQYTWQNPAPAQVGPDPLYPAQWHLHNTGTLPGTRAGEDINVRGAWALVKGEGVRIAVVDASVDVLHEDIAPNVVPGGSRNYQTWARGNAFPLPCSGSDFTQHHGTQVAGIIAARDDNAIGISGVAPRARLVGFNALHTGETNPLLVRDAFSRDLDKNHIFNNSWGGDPGGAFDGPPRLGSDGYRQLIQHALDTGRQGLGNIFVFGAGNNGNCETVGQTSCSRMLTTYDGYLNHQGVLAVCATDSAGNRAAYSTAGANLLVCAPSSHANLPGIRTTGIQNTYKDFGGTSAAAPMVSGVVALMLQANPGLTWRDVRLILAGTARKVDPGNPGWTTHGALNYHHAYGFGVVDATKAVQTARLWQSVGDSKAQKRCGPYRSAASAGPIPAYTGNGSADVLAATHPTEGYLNSDLQIPAQCSITQIEHVEIKANVLPPEGSSDTSANGEDLQIMLTSPSGQRSVVATPHKCHYYVNHPVMGRQIHRSACTGLESNVIGITRHMGEPVATPARRAWTLSIAHRGSAASATAGNRLKDWELTIYGR